MKQIASRLLASLAICGLAFMTGCAGRQGTGAGTSTGLAYRPSPGVDSPKVALGSGRGASTFERTTASGDKYLLTPTDWRVGASTWIGTPYRTGGETRKGADCSGFAKSLYKEVAGVDIPRTTSQLWLSGKPIDVMSIRAGDLLFFSNVGAGDGITHVGVVIGEGEFAHASTSQGVRFAHHDRGYWQKRFAGARRFLP
jgi:hypothetical protein